MRRQVGADILLMLLIALGLAFLFHPSLDAQPWALLAAIPVLALAFLLRFMVEWTLALAAFWTTRIGAINQTYFVLVLFLSGQIAPLTLFPYPLQVVAAILPFAEEMMNLASTGIFALRYPDHELTRQFREVTARLVA